MLLPEHVLEVEKRMAVRELGAQRDGARASGGNHPSRLDRGHEIEFFIDNGSNRFVFGL